MTAAKQINDSCNDERNADQFGRLDTQSRKDRNTQNKTKTTKTQEKKTVNKNTKNINDYKNNTKQNKQ